MLMGGSTLAIAGGLAAYEVGTADVGLATAGRSARAQDPGTALTNPAGMSRLPGTQIQGALQAGYGSMEFSTDAGTSPRLGNNDGGNPVGWVPGGGFFASHQISPDVTVGFAAAGTFGLGLSYDDDWVGRYRGQEAVLIGASLLPSVAYKLNDKLSLGASLNVMYGKLKLQTAVNNVRPDYSDGQLKLDDHEWGVGVNLGLLYEIDPATRLGLIYNSKVDLDYSAKPRFSGLAPGLERLRQVRTGGNGKLDLGIEVPQAIEASLFHQFNEKWALLGSVGWQEWSKFGYVNVSVDNTTNPQSFTTDLDFKNTWHGAVGAQYHLSEPTVLNFGVAYDSGFQRGNQAYLLLPSNATWRYGVGMQKQEDKSFEWGVGAEYVYGSTVDINSQGANPALGGRGSVVGSYDPRVYFLGANFIWKY